MELRGTEETKKGFGICIVPSIVGRASIRPLANISGVLSNLSDRATLLKATLDDSDQDDKALGSSSNGKITIVNLRYRSTNRFLSRAFFFVLTQMKMALYMLSRSRDFDLCIFYLGDTLAMPMIAAKISRKPVILILGSCLEEGIDFSAKRDWKILTLVKSVNLKLCDIIVVYSNRLIEGWKLSKHSKKVRIAHEHFIDFDMFRVSKPYTERRRVVGFVGRLAREKGVIELTNAIPNAIQKDEDIEFIICGDGPIRSEIVELIRRSNLGKRTVMPGWIPHDELPRYLNEMKLLVLPSYTEGLPNVLLEAMACGTPVLATGVGAIPDVIKDGETGFILADNSPETISARIMDVLSSPCLSKVSEKALELVRREFSYEETAQGWRNVLEDVDEELQWTWNT